MRFKSTFALVLILSTPTLADDRGGDLLIVCTPDKRCVTCTDEAIRHDICKSDVACPSDTDIKRTFVVLDKKHLAIPQDGRLKKLLSAAAANSWNWTTADGSTRGVNSVSVDVTKLQKKEDQAGYRLVLSKVFGEGKNFDEVLFENETGVCEVK